MARVKPMSPEGFYVYELVDPRDHQVFYIGKGSGGRAWYHEWVVQRGGRQNAAKCARIRSILDAGEAVRVSIVQAGMQEAEAYALERRLIAERRDTLTNVNDGGVQRPRQPSVVDPERVLLDTITRLQDALEPMRAGRESLPLNDAERPLCFVLRKCYETIEALTGKSLAPDGYEFEWAV